MSATAMKGKKSAGVSAVARLETTKKLIGPTTDAQTKEKAAQRRIQAFRCVILVSPVDPGPLGAGAESYSQVVLEKLPRYDVRHPTMWPRASIVVLLQESGV